MPDIELRLIGPDRYCPDCRRRLLSIDKDGEPIVSGKTLVVSQGGFDFNPFEATEEDWEKAIEVVPETFCMRRLCRLKRWMRKERVPEPPWADDPIYLLEKRVERLTFQTMVLGVSLAMFGVALLLHVIFD